MVDSRVMTAGLATVMARKSSTSPGCTGTCVSIQDFSFAPSALTVKAGTIVTWVNNRPSAHTTTSDAAIPADASFTGTITVTQ